MRKGVSPIVATVILIAVVLSIAIIVSSFFPGVLSGLTGETSNRTQTVAGSTDYRMDILEAEYNSIDDQTTLTVRNEKNKINGNITFTVYCNSAAVRQRQITGLKRSQVKDIVVDTPSCTPVRVRADLNNYPVSDELDTIKTANFGSWLQNAASDFQSVAELIASIYYNPLALNQDNSTQSETSSFSGNMANVTEDGGMIRLVT